MTSPDNDSTDRTTSRKRGCLQRLVRWLFPESKPDDTHEIVRDFYRDLYSYRTEPPPPELLAGAPGSEVWVQFACAALVGEMASISLHDQPHLWRPKQAEHSAEMADAMMAEYQKRWSK